MTQVIESTEGTTASFMKELVRRAVLVSLTERADASDEGDHHDGGMPSAPIITGAHLAAASAELLNSTNTLTRLALGSPAPE